MTKESRENIQKTNGNFEKGEWSLLRETVTIAQLNVLNIILTRNIPN